MPGLGATGRHHGGSESDSGKMVRVRPDDIRLSFNEAAEIYDKVRPSYPTVLFDALFQMLPSQPEIVEVGPGTGRPRKISLPEERRCSPSRSVLRWPLSCARTSFRIGYSPCLSG